MPVIISKMIRNSVIAVIVLVIGIAAVYYVATSAQDLSALEYVASQQKGKNEFKLGGPNINVSSAADIGFKIKGDHMEVYYGDQLAKIRLDSLGDEDVKKLMKRVGLEVQTNGEEYRLLYWGEVIEPWVD